MNYVKRLYWQNVIPILFSVPFVYLQYYKHINTQCCISQTKQNIIMFIIVLGQHVSILIESSSGPSEMQILT
jgi:hypothetical protein